MHLHSNAGLTGLTFFFPPFFLKLLALPAFVLRSLNPVPCFHYTIMAFNKRGIQMNFTHLGLLIWEEQSPDLHLDCSEGPKSQEKPLPLPSALRWVWSNPTPPASAHLPTGISLRFKMPPMAVSQRRGCVWAEGGMLSPCRGFSRKGPWCWQVMAQPSPVPVPWHCILAGSDRPQGRGMCPRAMPSALPGLAPCGIVPVVLLPFDG